MCELPCSKLSSFCLLIPSRVAVIFRHDDYLKTTMLVVEVWAVLNLHESIIRGPAVSSPNRAAGPRFRLAPVIRPRRLRRSSHACQSHRSQLDDTRYDLLLRELRW